MKRNLISVIILAISIINLILLSIIVFTVIPTNKKTDNLITSIASIVDLSVDGNGESSAEIPLTDITPYNMTDDTQVSLPSSGEETHYAVVHLVVSMNNKSDDYKTYDPTTDTGIKSYESVIQSTVNSVIKNYSAEDCNTKQDEIREEVKKQIKKLFNNSDVIYDVSFSKFIVS